MLIVPCPGITLQRPPERDQIKISDHKNENGSHQGQACTTPPVSPDVFVRVYPL